MGKIIMILVLFACMIPDMSAREGESFPRQKHSTVTRTDTVAVFDTIVRRKIVERREIIYRTETVIFNDSARMSESGRLVVPDRKGVEILENVVVERGDSIKRGVLEDVSPKAIQEVSDTVPSYAAGGDMPVVNLPVPATGGKYIWIPDSLEPGVRDIIAGNGDFNPNEKTLFRGDTVAMVLRSRNLGRYDRGLYNHLFIPRGIWQIGATASYGEFSTSDLEVLDLLSDIDFSGHLFSIRPYFQYFIANNMSVGMRLGYNSGKANIDSFKVDIDEDINFNLRDISYRSESYSAAVTFSQYYGIARRGRFGIFNEVELAFSSGNSDFKRPCNGVPKITHTTTMQANLNFSPGVSVFIMDPVSFNISFGVFGFHWRSEKQSVDGEDLGRRFTSGANFRFNIFNINFGIAVNL